MSQQGISTEVRSRRFHKEIIIRKMVIKVENVYTIELDKMTWL